MPGRKILTTHRMTARTIGSSGIAVLNPDVADCDETVVWVITVGCC